MKYALLAGAAAALLSLSATAAEKMDNGKLFNKLDKDGNGVISQQEASANKELMKQWKKLDKNSDGSLEKSEFAGFESAEAYTPVEGEDEPMGAAPTD